MDTIYNSQKFMKTMYVHIAYTFINILVNYIGYYKEKSERIFSLLGCFFGVCLIREVINFQLIPIMNYHYGL